MLTPIDFLTDLFNPTLAFLPRALLMAVLSAVVCGVVGTHVVLRGMAFIGDAVAHSVFPGLAVAFLVSGSLVLGGAVAGVTTAVLVALLSQNRRLKEDSVIGVLFVGAFALGVVVISRAPGYAGSLQDFLFGSITGVPASDVPVALAGGAVVLAMVAALHPQIVAVSLDRETARAAGLPVLLLDVLLSVAVSLAVVISVQTIGNVLVLALLVTPAATVRLLTDRLGTMMWLGPLVGALASVVGLYLSWSIDLPTGGDDRPGPHGRVRGRLAGRSSSRAPGAQAGEALVPSVYDHGMRQSYCPLRPALEHAPAAGFCGSPRGRRRPVRKRTLTAGTRTPSGSRRHYATVVGWPPATGCCARRDFSTCTRQRRRRGTGAQMVLVLGEVPL